MRVRISHLTIASAVLLLTAATASPMERITLAPGSRLWFDGTSTLRSWTCTADKIESKIDAESGVADAVLNGRKVAGTLEVEFPVEKLECKNGTMNEHMRKALVAAKHPDITFNLSGYDLSKGTPQGGTVQGSLTMNGQSHQVAVPVQFVRADGALRVTGKLPLNMTEWGVKPPKLMMGTIKVGNVVTVQFDLLLQH
ncbi:YceI family protein [Gemmatimonas groenlandica]|uniref:YceI family protein n=1 Tax=Gemmatimonas groenlandica TaxID=2732249 RepID=A0A6M4ILG3_9BACT|nr:YceI family protein [Gemmatimonas groenlandica]QJR34719.1 YceI family protein [Gemmatimonas groenlandica]